MLRIYKSVQDDVYIFFSDPQILQAHYGPHTLQPFPSLIESGVRMQIHNCESWLIFVASCHVGGLSSEISVLLQLAAIVFDADLDV